MEKEKLIRKYDKQVKLYKGVCNNRTLARWRSEITKSAYGDVLEVGVGIGANFPYYDSEDVRLTGVDFSPDMLESAKQTASDCQINAELLQKDVEELQFEPDSFDCIVSTLTMCGYSNPTDILNRFNRWCRNNGRILLLEHGISSNALLSRVQKIADPLFQKTAGCHLDRDMLKIVEKSDLQIDYTARYWSDIVSLIWASPVQ